MDFFFWLIIILNVVPLFFIRTSWMQRYIEKDRWDREVCQRIARLDRLIWESGRPVTRIDLSEFFTDDNFYGKIARKRYLAYFQRAWPDCAIILGAGETTTKEAGC